MFPSANAFRNMNDFTSYSPEQLAEALETIDDKKYLEDAVAIYKLLEEKAEGRIAWIDDKYRDDGILDDILEFVAAVTLMELQPTKSAMREKLQRIRLIVSEGGT